MIKTRVSIVTELARDLNKIGENNIIVILGFDKPEKKEFLIVYRECE